MCGALRHTPIRLGPFNSAHNRCAMAEIRTVTTLRRKRDEILGAIKLYERQLGQARADLAHVMAAIRIFEASGDPKDLPRYADLHRIFSRGETWAICHAALAK